MDHAKTMQSAYDRISAGDVPGFGALVAEDFVEYDEVPNVPPTKEGVLAYFEMLRSVFPDMKMEVLDLISSGDKAVARLKVSGTHRGEFMGIPATGKPVEMNLIDIMQFDGAGLIRAHWGVADMLSLMQQVGAIPAGP